MSEMIHLVTLKGYDLVGAAEVTRYYCTGLGFNTGPGDTPATTHFHPRVKQPASASRQMFGAGRTSGRTQLAASDLIFTNADGVLDNLLDLGLDGRAVIEEYGPDDGTYPADFATTLTGVMEQVDAAVETITVRVRAADFETAVPLQASKYGGSNSLPNGVDGVEGDLKRKPKPVLYGSVTNLAPPCVNTSRLEYQVNDGAVQAISAVYDQGVALTPGTAHANQAAMEGAATGAGTFDTWLGGGMFRLGSAPVGPVTCDCAEGANAAARYPAQIAKRILIDRLGFASGDVSAGDVTALDTAAPYECGFWWNEETTGTAALDEVLQSAGAWWGPDKDGLMRLAQFTAPSGTPVLALVAGDVIGPVLRSPVADQDRGIPTFAVIVRYGRNYTVQTTGLAGAVTAARRGVIAQEWREARYTDASVQTAHRLAREIVVETGIVSAANALTEATRLQALRGVRRDRFEFVVPQNTETALLDLGQVVSLTHPRYGLSGGALLRIIGVEPDAAAKTIRLTGWK
jgi:hypothetical protein